jgi:hypothetical protein
MDTPEAPAVNDPAWWFRLLWLGVQMERMAPPSIGIIAPVM